MRKQQFLLSAGTLGKIVNFVARLLKIRADGNLAEVGTHSHTVTNTVKECVILESLGLDCVVVGAHQQSELLRFLLFERLEMIEDDVSK